MEFNLLLVSFFKRSDGTMMKYTEIDKTYLDVYNDVIGLKSNFEKVQKPINDVVGKFFGTSPVDTTLVQISEFIIRHTHNSHVVNNFFGTPATSSITLSDITAFMTKTATLISIVNQFLGRTSASETSLTGPTLAEIKKSIEDIKTVADAVKDDFPRITSRLDKVKIPHEKNINNIVYTIDWGKINWIKGNINSVTIFASVRGIYRLTIISQDRFNIIVDGITVNSNIVSTIINKGITERLYIIAAKDSIVESEVVWYVEFVVELKFA